VHAVCSQPWLKTNIICIGFNMPVGTISWNDDSYSVWTLFPDALYRNISIRSPCARIIILITLWTLQSKLWHKPRDRAKWLRCPLQLALSQMAEMPAPNGFDKSSQKWHWKWVPYDFLMSSSHCHTPCCQKVPFSTLCVQFVVEWVW
jgi:hypothetical protein